MRVHADSTAVAHVLQLKHAEAPDFDALNVPAAHEVHTTEETAPERDP